MFGISPALARQVPSEPWNPNQPRVAGPVTAQEGQKMLSAGLDGADGSVFITGQTSVGDDGQTAITTWKFNRTDGSLAPGWPRTWSPYVGPPPTIPPPGYKGWGVCVLADNGGGCWVAGATTTDGEGLDIVLIRYQPDGQEAAVAIWNNGAQDGDDYPVDMALDNVGGLWLAGTSVGAGTGADYLVIGFNDDSLVVLGPPSMPAIARFDGDRHKADTAAALAVSPVFSGGEGGSNVNVSVTGTSFDALASGSKNDIVTLNYIWSNSVLSLVSPHPLIYAGDGGASNEVATGLATAAHAGESEYTDVYVCGYSDKVPSRSKDYVILGYPKRLQDPQNNPAWMAQYPPANLPSLGDDIPVKVTAVAGPDSLTRVIVTGTSWAGTQQNDIVTLAFLSTGMLQWSSVLTESDGHGNPFDDRAVSMATNVEGKVYLLGKRYQDKNGDGLYDFDFLTYAINVQTGAGSWPFTPTYNAPGGGPDGPAAIDVLQDPIFPDPLSPDVFVAGSSLGMFESQTKYVVNRYKQN